VLPIVPVPPKELDEYVAAAGADAVERLREAARPLKGARLLHVNSTAFGGGVAELLMTHVPLLADLGLDVSWVVMQGHDGFFACTKTIHNALQGGEAPWTPEMAATYRDCVRDNAAELTEPFDFTFVHDPQPAAVLDVLEEEGRRKGRWVWRCHIDLSAPHAPVWNYFAPTVNRYDAAVFTLDAFAQPGVTDPVVAFIPPSIDPESTKNFFLNDEAVHDVLSGYGIDRERPLITQISRFDPWKDPLGVIDAYRLVKREYPEVQLALVGSMAHDDPEGWHFLEATDEYREGDQDIHLLTNFQDVGALEVNAFQRGSTILLQKSIREGFGLTVSEAMWKQRPVIGGDVGGIRLQIVNGETGFLVGSVEECAERIATLLEDPAERLRMGQAGHQRVRERFLSLRELEDYLRLLVSIA
jgi:trehalose synthase